MINENITPREEVSAIYDAEDDLLRELDISGVPNRRDLTQAIINLIKAYIAEQKEGK